MTKTQKNDTFYILLSPGFIIATVLLVVNDFFLKPVYHNWLTGKLSDFAGLFMFSLFLTMFLTV